MKFIFSMLFLFLYSFSNAQMLTSVYFEHNSFELNQESIKKLDSLYQLKSNLIFRIFGNANILGNENLNKKLSEQRAKSVNDYLQKRISKNIKLGSSVGLGESKQINDNSTEELLAKNRRVDIFIEKSLHDGETISRKEYPNFLYKKIAEMKLKDTFSLPNVNFFRGRHIWLPKARINLARLVKMLKDNPTMEIEIQGHICCEYNDFDGEDIDLGTYNLSYTRAKAIKDYLEKQGIDSTRLKAKGLGHLNPIVYPEKTESDRTKNRRVELMLLKK